MLEKPTITWSTQTLDGSISVG